MPVTHKLSGTLYYQGYHGCDSHCQLDLYQRSDGKYLAIVTELADNPGTSVTNRIEHLATKISVDYQIAPKDLLVIEHYGEMSYRNPRNQEHHDMVTFQWANNGVAHKPQWKRVNLEEILF